MRTGGRGKHNFIIGGAFRKAKYEIRRRRESEGGQKFLPPNPLPFCPPERSVSVLPRVARQRVSFFQKRFAHFQTKGTSQRKGSVIM